MGTIDRRLKRIEENPDAEYKYIELKDGGRFWFKREELYKSFGLYYLACLGADARREERPSVPPLFEAIAQAEDRAGAMEEVLPGWRNWKTDYSTSVCIDLDRLVDEGVIAPYDWVRHIEQETGQTLEEMAGLDS